MKGGRLRNRKDEVDHPKHSQPPECWSLFLSPSQSQVDHIGFSCHFEARLRFIREGIERRLGLQNAQ